MILKGQVSAMITENQVKNYLRSKDKDYDVVDTVANQVFKSEEDLKDKWKDKYLENINKIKEVVLATSGEYLTYDKKVIESFFFSELIFSLSNSTSTIIL